MSNVIELELNKPELSLIWIKPNELAKYWDLILFGVESVLEHGTAWRAEDLYTAVKTGHSSLHIGYLDGKYGGFIVSTQEIHPKGHILNIWAAYSSLKDRNILHECAKTIDEWAKNIDAVSIRYQTPRKGWEKVGPELGFKPILTIYEKEV